MEKLLLDFSLQTTTLHFPLIAQEALEGDFRECDECFNRHVDVGRILIRVRL